MARPAKPALAPVQPVTPLLAGLIAIINSWFSWLFDHAPAIDEGNTFTVPQTFTGSASRAPVNLVPLATPSSPSNGDTWVDTSDSTAKVQIGGSTKTLASTDLCMTTNLADPGTGQAIPVTRSAYIGIVSGGSGETNTLADPTFLGQVLILNMDTFGGGNRVITAAHGINQTGNTVMTFGAARDFIRLVAIKVGGAFRWAIASNDGVALS